MNPLATTFAAIATDSAPFEDILSQLRAAHLNGDHEESKEWFWAEVCALLDNQHTALLLANECAATTLE